MTYKFLYRSSFYAQMVVCLVCMVGNLNAQSFLEDWKQVQSFYKNATTLELRIMMRTEKQANVEKQTLLLSKYKNQYYYHLGDTELSINQKSMLLIHHTQRVIVRQSIPKNHVFGHQMIVPDTLFKAFKNAIQYVGVAQGQRHYRIRPNFTTDLVKADYYFTGTGQNTRLTKVIIQYRYQGTLYITSFQLTTTTVLKDKRKFQQNYFLTTQNQQWVGIGKYANYRVTDQ